MIGMTGLLNAQMNLQLASQIQHIANSTVQDGRIRVRQGMMSGDEKAVEEGMALQARGEETRGGVFNYLGKAMDDVNAAAKECEEAANERKEAAQARLEAAKERREANEIRVENPSGHIVYAPGEFDVSVGDTVRVPNPVKSGAAFSYTVSGSGNISVPVSIQAAGVKLDVAV